MAIPGSGPSTSPGGGVSPQAASRFARAAAGESRFVLVLDSRQRAGALEGIVKLLQRTDSVGSYNVNSPLSPTQIGFAQEDFLDDDYFYDYDSANPSQLKVRKAGRYAISYTISAESSGSCEAHVWARKNGSSTLDGSHSLIHLEANAGVGSGTARFVVDLVADDYVELLGQRFSGSASTGSGDTVADYSSVLVELLSGSDYDRPGGRVVVPYPCEIERVLATKALSDPDATESTRIDVRIDDPSGPTSIFYSGNEIEFSTTATVVEVEPYWLNVRSLFVGETLSLEVLSEQDPPPRDIHVFLQCLRTR